MSDFIGAGRLFFDEVGLTFYRPASPKLLHLLLKCGEQLFLSSLKLVFYGIVAHSFLHRTVRNLVGPMLDVADCRLSEYQFLFMMDEDIRPYSYVAAPPEGLEVFKIYY